jgi:hypothetical protein
VCSITIISPIQERFPWTVYQHVVLATAARALLCADAPRYESDLVTIVDPLSVLKVDNDIRCPRETRDPSSTKALGRTVTVLAHDMLDA